MVAHPWLIPAIPAALAALAFVLLWLGLRGRGVDDHPVCRRCAYDLIGLPPERAACPECGSDLRRPRAVRTGNRRRRRGLIALAAVLLVPSAAALGLIGWVSGRGVDVQRHKPVWWLLGEADGPDAAARAAAFAQLTKRLTRAELSESQVRAVAGRALDRQADAGRTWDPAWGDWVEQAQMLGYLPADQWQRYVDQAIDVRVRVRSAVRRGDVLPYRIEVPTRLGRSGTYRFRVFAPEPRFEFPGVSQPPRIGRMENVDLEVGWAGQIRGSVDSVLWVKAIPFDQLADGPQRLRLPLDVAVYPAPSPGDRGKRPFAAPIVRKQLAPEASWELLPADTPSLRKLAAGPSLRDAIRAAVAAGVSHEPRDDSVRVSLVCRNCPVPLAFDVWIRAGSKEWKIGSGYVPQGGATLELGADSTGPPWHRAVPNARGLTAETVDVVLRPNAREVVRSLDGTELWDEEVVLPEVPVRRPKDPQERMEEVRRAMLRAQSQSAAPTSAPAGASGPPTSSTSRPQR